MTDHRQAINEQQRRNRLASASTKDEHRLAEVESAVAASQEQLAKEPGGKR